MPKPKKSPQQALRDLLTSPKVKQQVASLRKSRALPEVSQVLSTAGKNGDIEVLCQLMVKSPVGRIPQPIYLLMERLRFLSQAIEDDYFDNVHDPAPTEEWLVNKNNERDWLPVGTRKAAQRALVDFAQAWVEGMVKGYTIQPIPTKAQDHSQNKRGPKDKVDSLSIYGHPDGRQDYFSTLLEYVESFPKEKYWRGKGEEYQDFEARGMELVQDLHTRFCPEHPNYFSAWVVDRTPPPGLVTQMWMPLPELKRMPEELQQTIVLKALTPQKKKINLRHLVFGLMALYERNDPSQFKSIRQLITRKV